MSSAEDYRNRMEGARREAARAPDPQTQRVWRGIAEQWEALARQAQLLERADPAKADPPRA